MLQLSLDENDRTGAHLGVVGSDLHAGTSSDDVVHLVFAVRFLEIGPAFRQNVDAGTKLLKQLLGKYNGDMKLTLAAYNAGSGRVDSEGGVPPIPETINYVIDILSKLPKK